MTTDASRETEDGGQKTEMYSIFEIYPRECYTIKIKQRVYQKNALIFHGDQQAK